MQRAQKERSLTFRTVSRTPTVYLSNYAILQRVNHQRVLSNHPQTSTPTASPFRSVSREKYNDSKPMFTRGLITRGSITGGYCPTIHKLARQLLHLSDQFLERNTTISSMCPKRTFLESSYAPKRTFLESSCAPQEEYKLARQLLDLYIPFLERNERGALQLYNTPYGTTHPVTN